MQASQGESWIFSPSISTSEVQVFPSSFSIAALIGAAAIRERVVTNLRLSGRQEDGESQPEFKRKLSGELNPGDEDQGSDLDNDIKKPKIEDETNSLVTLSQPKIVNLKENPIFDQIKLANCFLRDQSLMKAQRAWDLEEERRGDQDNKISSPVNLISNMSVSSPGNSLSSPDDFNQKNSSSAGKQSVVNSNTKLLEKVSSVKTEHGRSLNATELILILTYINYFITLRNWTLPVTQI